MKKRKFQYISLSILGVLFAVKLTFVTLHISETLTIVGRTGLMNELRMYGELTVCTLGIIGLLIRKRVGFVLLMILPLLLIHNLAVDLFFYHNDDFRTLIFALILPILILSILIFGKPIHEHFMINEKRLFVKVNLFALAISFPVFGFVKFGYLLF